MTLYIKFLCKMGESCYIHLKSKMKVEAVEKIREYLYIL